MILGFNISSINAIAEELKGPVGQVSINSVPNITDVQKASLPDIKDVLRIKFTFATNYQPNVGEIKLEGALLWRGKDQEKVLKMWQEGKKLDADAAVEILNAIFRRCLTRVVGLSEELRLPPPIQFPKVRAGEPAKPAKAA